MEILDNPSPSETKVETCSSNKTVEKKQVFNDKKILCKLCHRGTAFELTQLIDAVLKRYKTLPNGHNPTNYSQLKEFKMTCIIEEY